MNTEAGLGAGSGQSKAGPAEPGSTLLVPAVCQDVGGTLLSMHAARVRPQFCTPHFALGILLVF